MRNRFANFNTKFFVLFINHTIKYTPQNWLIWNLIKIVCNTFFLDKKESCNSIKKFAISLQILHFSHFSEQKASLSAITHCQY